MLYHKKYEPLSWFFYYTKTERKLRNKIVNIL